MAVICATCGEELLGAVNRCWKCGREVLSTPDAATAPPVRRAPVLQAAQDGDAEAEKSLPANDSPDGDAETPLADADVSESAATQAIESPAPNQPAINSLSKARSNRLGRDGIAPWPAIASVVMGLSSMALGALSPWALLLAGGGLVCGILGLQSHRRITATIGLLICLMGVTVGSVRLAFDTFIFIRGEPIAPTEPLPEDDLLLDPFDSIEPSEPLE